MNRKRRLRTALGAIALVLVVSVALLRTDRAGEFVCTELRTRLPAALDAEVVIARCQLDPLTGSVEARGVSVTPHGASAALVSADRAIVSLRGLFLGGVALQDVRLVRPTLELNVPQAPTPAQPTPPQTTCPLTLLKRVRVANLRIEDAKVHIIAGTKDIKLEGFSVQANLGSRDAELVADARSGSLELEPGRLLRLGRLTLDGSLDLSGEVLDLQRAEANVEGVTVSLTGQLEGLCDASPQVTASGQLFVPIDALPRLGLPLPSASGQVWTRVALSGHLDALKVRAELQATQVAIGPFTPGDFSARVVLGDKKIVIEDFSTKAGEGDVKLSGEIALTDGFPVKVKLETREASFGKILTRASVPVCWVEFPASVKAVLTGHLAPLPNLGGEVDFHTGRFTLATKAFDAPASVKGLTILSFSQATGTFHFAFTNEGAFFEDIALQVGPEGHTHVRGQVHLNPFDMRRFLDIAANFEQLDLSDFGMIAELPWSGMGTLHGTIKGGDQHVVVDAQTTLRDFKFDGYSLGVLQSPIHFEHDTLAFPTVVAQKGQTQYFGDVELDFLEAGLHARSTVQLPDGRLEDVVDLLADLSPTFQNLQGGSLTGRVSALAAIDSPAKELTGVIALHARDTEYLQRQLGEAEVILRFDHGLGMVLEPLAFEGPLGRFTAQGRWNFAGPLDFDLAAQGPLAELLDPKSVDHWPVGGPYSFAAKVGGTTDEILVDGSFDSTDVTWKGRSLGLSHLDGHLIGRDFAATGTVIPGIKATLKMKAQNDWPFETRLAVDLDDLGPFLPASSAQISARTKGVVTASGPAMDFKAVRATASLESLVLSRADVTASNSAPVELAYNAGAFEIRSLSMKGPTTEFAAEGSWGPTLVDLKSRGSVDLRLLSSFVSSIERTQGRLDFTAAFTGSVKSPSLAGSAEVSDVRFAAKAYDLQVRALTGRADFSESRVLIQDVQGFLNDGRVRSRGDIKLEHLGLKTAELQVDLEDVTAQIQPDVPVTVSGALLLSSRTAGQWLVQGGIDVQKFRYTQPLALESLLASAKKGIPTEEIPDEWLRYDVDIAMAGDARIDNNLARARLLGKVKVSGTNVKPVLIGAVEVGEGAQAFFRGNTYAVSRGLLQFNGLWPTFDLSALSQVREYLVSVKAFGRIDDPKISLSSEPSLSYSDIFSLITIGVTSRDKTSGQSVGAGLAAEALMSASGLDQQVQKFLSQNVGLKDQQVRLTTSFNETTGTAEPSVSWESKVGSDNLKVGVTQPVTGRGTKAQAEYRINQQVSARAQWDNQNQSSPFGNPGVDIRFHFEWE